MVEVAGSAKVGAHFGAFLLLLRYMQIRSFWQIILDFEWAFGQV
jgi:hypothetical protein